MQQEFLDELRTLGGSAGNGRLREALAWDEVTYDSVRLALVNAGLIRLGPGRGGSVALADGDDETDADAPGRPAGPKGSRRRKAARPATGGDLGFEAELFKAADKLRGNLEPSEYKHVALGLIFLKYISEAFEAQYEKLLAEEYADPEDPEEYLAANAFWVPREARWANLQANAKRREIEYVDVATRETKRGDIGSLIDNAMEAIEQANIAVLKDVLPKIYSRPQLDKTMLGELIDLFSNIDLMHKHGEAKDLLGRAYEYFISEFAGAEGKRGGEFFTPRAVVRTLVAMLEPTKGRVYDPCCGSGGMFVQSEAFVEEHQGKRSDIAIYGQERNHTTWRLCKMNLAVRGIDADIKWNNEGSFLRDEFPQLKFDYVMANPPFNISDWWQGSLEGDVRWALGTPPPGNANYAWLQHIIHHLAPRGTAGVVLANGSLTSNQSGEGQIRQTLVEQDLVSCVITLPTQLFYSTQISASIWILCRNKHFQAGTDRRGQVLFIDARSLGVLVDRTRRDLSDEEIGQISNAYSAWRGSSISQAYVDIPGFCKSVTKADIADHKWALVPGRYVGFDRSELSPKAIDRLKHDFADLRGALEALPAELARSISTFEQIFNG